jgi:hypothetical protein
MLVMSGLYGANGREAVRRPLLFGEARILLFVIGIPYKADPWINVIFSNVSPVNYSLVAASAPEKNSIHAPLA